MQLLICLLPVVPMRKEPSHRSEMVSQLLLGEYAQLLAAKEDFWLVRCRYDGYEGWVQAVQLTPVEAMLEPAGYVGCAMDEVLINGNTRMLSLGSPVYQPGELLLFGGTTIQYLPGQGCLWPLPENPGLRPEALEKVCLHYLYSPYLWGGKSVFGIDCSGFSQQVMKLFGIPLLRDAYQQAEQGTAVASLAEAQCGDLAFFQNEAGRVTHVGILLASDKIVHAAGRVRIDPVDAEGITNVETGKRTHRLHSIRTVQGGIG